MKTRSYNTRPVETLEGRTLMSAVVTGDFNNDGRLDKAEVTSPTTITVSLQKLDGSYQVSATLTAPKNRPVTANLYAVDYDNDGDLDITTVGGTNNGGWYVNRWLNNGDGTFGSVSTQLSRFHPRAFLGF